MKPMIEEMKIVALGDSITAGYPFTSQDSWTARLAQELNCEVLNQGVNGDYTIGMRSRFSQDVLAYGPSHVVILGGSNDAAVQMRLESVIANFSAMVEISRQNNIIPVLGLPIPFLVPQEEQLLAEYRNWLKDYARQQGVSLLDFYAPFAEQMAAGQGRKLYVDVGHPSLAGYMLMGEAAVSHFKRILLEK